MHVLRNRRRGGELLRLDEATRRLRPFNQRYLGVRSIPLAQVVGTDGRGADFDRDFRPRRSGMRFRWRDVARAFPDGNFPAIVVYKLGDAYFVIDGHHRVAIARRRGMVSIDAEVTELRARWRLSAAADVVELVHAEQERIFAAESGLSGALPDARFRFSRPVGYLELLEQVQLHGYGLMRAAGRALDAGEIAADWHARVYLPTVEAIGQEGAERVCPTGTDPDRFLWVQHKRRELLPDHGALPLEDGVRLAIAHAPRSRRLFAG